jgi:hypothetical protein
MVEEDVPQSLGVLAKLLRHLEDYQAVRAAEPRAAYNDLAVAEEIWPESDDASENNTALAEDANDEKDVRHA